MRPKKRLEFDQVLYSGLFGNLDEGVKKFLMENKDCYSQHSNWDFCGWVWFDGKLWNEEVHVFGDIVDTKQNENLEDMIDEVILEYGNT